MDLELQPVTAERCNGYAKCRHLAPKWIRDGAMRYGYVLYCESVRARGVNGREHGSKDETLFLFFLLCHLSPYLVLNSSRADIKQTDKKDFPGLWGTQLHVKSKPKHQEVLPDLSKVGKYGERLLLEPGAVR